MRRFLAALFWALAISAPTFAEGQTVTATWDPSPVAQGVTGYQVCVGTAPVACNLQLASVPVAETSFAFAPTAGVLEYVAVRAVGATGAGPYSSSVSFSVPDLLQPSDHTARIGVPIAPVQLSVNDPDGSPLTFTHTGLPLGLSIEASGWVIGTPTVAGRYDVTVFVSDGLGTSSRSFVWIVTDSSTPDLTAPALSITSHTPNQTVNVTTVTISGTATDSELGSSGITSVTVNGQPASGGAASGNGTAVWSRPVSLTTGRNTITVEAYDGAGNLNMKQLTLNYQQPVPEGVSALSVTPASGSGTTQLFVLQYADSRGASSLVTTWAWFNDAFAGGPNSCMVYYDRAANRLNLLDDAGGSWMSGLLGSSGTLQNRQCAITLGISSAVPSGTTLNLNLAMTFTTAFSGAKHIYMFANAGNLASGWQDRGTWTVPAPSAPEPAQPPPAAPGVSAVSVTPASGSGSSQMFALQYTDSRGASSLSTTWAWFNDAFAGGANSCMVYYDRAANRLQLLDNAGQTWISGVLGSGTLQNSQCAIALGSSSAVPNGTTLTLNLAMTFTSAFGGAKHVYMFANAAGNLASGWQDRGTWSVPVTALPPPPAAPGITAVSASPGSGSGSSQIFALQYADSRGASYLATTWAWFNQAFAGGPNSCMVYYDRAANRVQLLNDAGTTWLSAPLGGGTLQNTQCAINLGGSSVAVNGTTLTLNLAMTFKPSYSGTKHVYMFANAAGNLTSGWQDRATWIVP